MKGFENVIKLFNCVPISKREEQYDNKPIIKGRFIFLPELTNFTDFNDIYNTVNKILSLSAKQMNSSFHKSWKKIKETNIEQLVYEQLVHYFTTYGFESLGIYDSNSVYIPTEKLKIPKLNIDKIELIVIRGITRRELKDRILKILCSGIALKKETIDIMIEIISDFDILLNKDDIYLIKNKEAKMILQDRLNIIPQNPVELLRFIIYRLTGETLLIKSKELINKIKISDIGHFDFNILEDVKSKELVDKIKKGNAYRIYNLLKNNKEKLAEIFNRFKPLFLAMKHLSFKKTINKISKLSKKYHKPMKQDYLNNLTSMDYMNFGKLKEELDKVNIFRKIRLLNALKFRKIKSESIIYKIRNGKSFACKNNLKKMKYLKEVYSFIKDYVKKEIRNRIGDKKIYIPKYIKYAFPLSEKQFIGNISIGTSIKVDKDMVFGAYWKNVNGNRIDLDLSLLTLTGKYGWDASYKNQNNSVLFSGDMTDAKKGASELFYISRNEPGFYLMMINYYNYNESIPVPFKLFVAKQKIKQMKKNYVVNPNNVLITVGSEMKRKQKILGLIKVENEKIIFYFYESDIGKGITSSNKKYMIHSRTYLKDFYSNLLTLNKIIKDNITEDNENCDIDLSPENLTKDSLLDIII